MTTVPLLDLKAQYAQIRAAVMPVIEEVCESQYFILGKHVTAFEADAARYCGAQHGIGVSSGTDALLLALMALDIGPGDEVITSPFTFFATGGTIARAGARPLYCDIDPVSFNLSPAAVEAFIDAHTRVRGGVLVNRVTGGRIRAIMPVHLYGQSADMDPLLRLARAHGLAIIEDAAQAIGTEYHGRRVGSIGDVGCFSFFPSKNLGAFGDAGLCTANDPELAERLKVLRVHGGKPKYYHALIGGNFRIDELQAAVLEVKLKFLDGWTEGRQRNARFYDAAFAAVPGLGAHLRTPRALPGMRHIFNQYVVRVARRDELRQFLAENGVGTEIYYPVPLHLQECFGYLGYRVGDLPHSELAARETLALPVYAELTEAQLRYVVDTIARFYAG